MDEQKIIDTIMNSIFMDGVCPEIVYNEGFIVKDVGWIEVMKNIPNYVNGTVSLDIEDNDMEIDSIPVKFEIDNNNVVKFGELVW